MNINTLIKSLSVAERLKNTERHCYTSSGRHESVAEHSWRLALAAYWVSDEFPEINLEKLLKMCIIHDLGEAFTGDIPCFEKTTENENTESERLNLWLTDLPAPFGEEMKALFAEMKKLETLESKIFKALDNLESLIQHNESDIDTWISLEYELQMVYGNDKVAFSSYLTELRELVRDESKKKIEESKNDFKESTE